MGSGGMGMELLTRAVPVAALDAAGAGDDDRELAAERTVHGGTILELAAHDVRGGGYGAGVSLRNMDLTLDEIINVIKCGRPGTGMPYFLRKAYKEEKCYDTTFEDYDGSYRPVSSKKFLSLKK